MGDLRKLLQFGWKYMRPYWSRLLTGLIIGSLCGLTAGAFLWATQKIAERLTPKESRHLVCAKCGTHIESFQCPNCAATVSAAPQEKAKPKKVHLFASLQKRLDPLKDRIDAFVDDWLPRIGADFNWKNITGGLLLLPLLALIRGTGEYLSNYCMGWVS